MKLLTLKRSKLDTVGRQKLPLDFQQTCRQDHHAVLGLFSKVPGSNSRDYRLLVPRLWQPHIRIEEVLLAKRQELLQSRLPACHNRRRVVTSQDPQPHLPGPPDLVEQRRSVSWEPED